MYLSDADFQAVARVVKLGTWSKQNVEELLRAYGFVYESARLELFYGLIEKGFSPSIVLEAIHTMCGRRVE